MTAVMVLSDDKVNMDNGKLETVGFEKCNITNKGVTMTSKRGKHEGYYFRPVNWQCGLEYGYIVLKMDCFDCGLYTV